MKALLENIKTGILQIRSLWRLLIGIYLPVLIIFLGVVLLTYFNKHLTIPDLIRDVADLGELPFYAGAVSQLGLLLWSAATTLCFFTYFTLRRIAPYRTEPLNFLLFAGLLTGYLTLDDTYMLHEEFFPDYLQLIPEPLVVLFLGIAMVAFLYFNHNEIMRGEFSLMFLAYMFFGISIVFDAIPRSLYETNYLFEKIEHVTEDSAKLAAIITWVTFYARYGYFQILSLTA